MPPRNSNRQKPVFDEFDDERLDDGAPFGSGAGQRLVKDMLGRWYWIALAAVLGVLAAAYYLSKAPKVYSADATLLLKQQVSSVMKSDISEDLDPKTAEALNTAVSRIRRLDLLEKVAADPEVRKLDGLIPPPTNWKPSWLASAYMPPPAPQSPPAPAQLAEKISGWLDVSVEKGTRLVKITIKHQNRDVAVALVDHIAAAYLTEVADARSLGRDSSSSLLLRESEETRKRLQASEGALASYTRALEMHKNLEAKEQEVQTLQNRYLPKFPKMAAATAQLEADQARFLEEFNRVRKSKVDGAYWQTVADSLEGASPSDEVAIARHLLLSRIGVLQSEIESQKAVYGAMLTKMEETTVNSQSNESSVEISGSGRVQPGVSPAPLKIYVAGGMGGLALGFALAFLLVQLDGKFHSVTQLEEDTNYPALAAVSQITAGALRKEAPEQGSGPVASKFELTPLHENWHENLVFRPQASTSMFAEMFRVLRASVSLLGDEKKRKVTLFSSAIPGEGKTMISCNFALASASQGKKTILIDLDLRKPAVHKMFGLTREHESRGITEYLSNHLTFEEAIVKDSGHSHLHLILGGKRAPNPGELLDNDRLQEILEYAVAHYDVVVIDSAPLLAVPDTRTIAPLVDNICLVVRAEYAPKGAVARTLEILESANTSPAGLVLNGYKERKRLIGGGYSYGGRGYGYGYGYGYGAYGVYGNDDDSEPAPKKTSRKAKAG